LSTLRRTSLALAVALALAACTEEQSKSVGQIPKKTVDKATADINKAMQQGQGSERLKEDDK
jgi:type IV pilus biogenesis protein CpaD/CtpE